MSTGFGLTRRECWGIIKHKGYHLFGQHQLTLLLSFNISKTSSYPLSAHMQVSRDKWEFRVSPQATSLSLEEGA